MIPENFQPAGQLPVRRLGYGTAQLTGPGYWGPRGEARDAVAVPRRAVERGVTLIDTADNYGPSIAEELVAARSGTSGSTR
ncbi:aryl-alcohol dehydrogenase-like predicted oxidoreductase [Streptomyces phaeochromogenes]|uniref:aldo/keto reductase n=1 Tax=Streptomyces phaeochromogenes TaxID=1923 RepID=UPI002793B80D|nr:aryl-alcohol dehydrogenase-like predicted oxidoreductase [Streptomyces phaeochromogenes]